MKILNKIIFNLFKNYKIFVILSLNDKYLIKKIAKKYLKI